MTLTWLVLLVVALGLAWWVARRAVRFRREAERREAKVLEALFAARQTAGGGAIDVEQILGAAPPAAPPASADAVLRAVGMQAEVVDLVTQPLAERPADRGPAVATESPPANRQADRQAASPLVADPADTAEEPPCPPTPVRDLVQVFYEARGFLPAPADPSARPVEEVLTHKSDARRGYAFTPLTHPPSGAMLQSIIERAHGIGQKRVLIAVEGRASPGLEAELPAHGVRVIDRATIETQLERLDAAVAERIRTTAWRRAGRRLKDA